MQEETKIVLNRHQVETVAMAILGDNILSANAETGEEYGAPKAPEAYAVIGALMGARPPTYFDFRMVARKHHETSRDKIVRLAELFSAMSTGLIEISKESEKS